ncbi:MAG TPA: hypothetical protein VGL99_04775, partial [Chloroflexota bacterium]
MIGQSYSTPPHFPLGSEDLYNLVIERHRRASCSTSSTVALGPKVDVVGRVRSYVRAGLVGQAAWRLSEPS